MKWSNVFLATAILGLVLAPTLSSQQNTDAKKIVDAIQRLVHARRFEETTGKVEALPADDEAWNDLWEVLVEAAGVRNDYSYLQRKAREIMLRGRDAYARGRLAAKLSDPAGLRAKVIEVMNGK